MTLRYHCARCGEQFETERRDRRYCSPTCMKAWARPRPITKRYPFAPIQGRLSAGLTYGEIATRLSVDGGQVAYNQVARWADYGLSRQQAEMVATRIDAHPYELWPEMADDDAAALQKFCIQCGGLFWPSRRTHRYCSWKCQKQDPEIKRRNAAAAKARYRVDEEYRERQARYRRENYSARYESLQSRRYRETHRDEIAAREKRYRAENRDRLIAKDRERYRLKREEMLVKQRARDQHRRLVEKGWVSAFAVPLTYDVMRGAVDALLCENPKRNAGFVARELKRLKPPELETLEMAA